MEAMPQRHADAVTSGWAAGPAGRPATGTDLVLSLGNEHPSGHGMLRLRLTLDGERVTAADPVMLRVFFC